MILGHTDRYTVTYDPRSWQAQSLGRGSGRAGARERVRVRRVVKDGLL